MEYDPDADGDETAHSGQQYDHDEEDLLDAALAFIEDPPELYGGGPYGPNTTFTREPSDLDPGHQQAQDALADIEVQDEGLDVIYDTFCDETEADADRLIGLFASAVYEAGGDEHDWDVDTDGGAAYVAARLPADTTVRISERVLGAGDSAAGYIINEARAGGLGYGHSGVVVNRGEVGELAARASGLTLNTADGETGRCGQQHRGLLINHGEADTLAPEAGGLVINHADGVELPSDAGLVIDYGHGTSSTEGRRGPDGTLIDVTGERDDRLHWDTVWDSEDLDHHPVLRTYLEGLGDATGPDQASEAIVADALDYADRPAERIGNELRMLTGGDIDGV